MGLGRQQTVGVIDKQSLTTDGSTVEFTLSYQVGSVNSMLIIKNNTVLEPGPGADFTISEGGKKVVFSSAPGGADSVFIIFLGKELQVARSSGLEPAYETAVGDGVTTDFTLTNGPLVQESLIIFVDKTLQRLTDDFTLSGSTVSFVSPPASSADIDFYIHGIERVDTNVLDSWSVDATKALVPDGTSQDIGSSTSPIGDLFVGGDVSISGDFTVSGTTTTIDTTDLLVDDNQIVLNSNYTSGSPILNLGIDGERGDDPNAQMIWNEVTDTWQCGTVGDLVDIVRDGDTLDSLNGETGATQTFSTGSSGTDFNISSGSNTHTLAGSKTFSTAPTLSSVTASRVLTTNSSSKITVSGVTTTELTSLNNLNDINSNYTEKTTVSNGDLLLVEDSDDSYNKKKMTAATFGAVITGTILPYASADGDPSNLPSGYLYCNGDAVSRTTYSDLFAVCGTAFGVGDGSTTFNVPDMSNRFMLGSQGMGAATPPAVPDVGDTGGSFDHTHSVPAHYHGMSAGSTLNVTSSGAHVHSISHDHGAVTSSNQSANHTHWMCSGDVLTSGTPGTTMSTSGTGNGLARSSTVNSSNIDYELRSAGNTPNRAATSGNTSDHTHTVNLPNYTGNSVTASHTHAAGDFSGHIGLVTGGSDGDASMTSGSNNPPYLKVNFIIKT